MKNTLMIITAIACIAIACGNAAEYAGAARQITPRDVSINKSNSYSDLFLDSNSVEQFITQQSLNDTIANDMRSFYNARNYQYAWFASDGLTEQALAFNSLYDYTQDEKQKQLDRKLDEMMSDEDLRPAESNTDIQKTELSLTWRFINYAWKTYADADTRSAILETAVPAKKLTLAKATEMVLADKSSDQVHSNNYVALKKLLKNYADTAFHSKDTLLSQQQKDSAQMMVRRLLINIERAKWLPREPAGKSILVNIPEFKLHVLNGSQKDFDMDIVVGKDGHNTVLFSGRLNQVVFSPYWNVPRSIVSKEILPAMEKNANYLAEKNMEITGEENELPVVRQLPGEKNDLGKVKFLFPNSFNIYFHDTPYKELFNKDKRAYSHGCIRLSDPSKMAAYLLQDQAEWTPEKIEEAMNSGKEKYVKVKDPVPVIISYYTAWTDENGHLQVAEDIYQHDSQLAGKLFL